jgi:energy-coupling factor transport system ATP-binding protein
MVQKVLEVRNLGYKQILTQVNFELSQDKVIALMGSNGSGKSTLARLLTGLLMPTEGDITLYEEGKRVPWSERLRWKEVTVVGQHPQRQTIGATVAEELGFGLLNLGYNAQEVKERVIKLAEQIGLKEQLNQSPATLSGGERQRLVLASVLAIHPSFLILDESLSMLDRRVQENIIELLRTPAIGQLWITHDPQIAERADRLLLLGDKTLIDAGQPQEILSNSKLCREYGIRSSSLVYSLGGIKHSLSNNNKIKPDVLIWQDVCYPNGVSLTQAVRQEEFLAIVGPSGAGKSTIIEGIAGLRLPSLGKLSVRGEQICSLRQSQSTKMKQTVQLIQQEAGEYLIGRTVYDEVFYTLPKKERLKNAQKHQEYIQEYGISRDKILQSPEQLSGGERQKVALAAALESAPDFLLLDEPLIGLDYKGREDFLARLAELKKGRTILYVTHDLREILKLADRIWLIEEGQVTMDCLIGEYDTYAKRLESAGIML